MADFQPIDTAPKDGTVIGAWSANDPAVIRIVRWGRHLNGPRQPEGWVTITRSIMISNVPTHYIELGQLPGDAPIITPTYGTPISGASDLSGLAPGEGLE